MNRRENDFAPLLLVGIPALIFIFLLAELAR
jgi:hypothetical protein